VITLQGKQEADAQRIGGTIWEFKEKGHICNMGMALKGLWQGHWRDGRKDGGWASRSKGQPFLCDFFFPFIFCFFSASLLFLFCFSIFMHYLPADLSFVEPSRELFHYPQPVLPLEE
jgi:hypothetical protein